MKRINIADKAINLPVIKATLMIAGTAVGAGMLGIPLVTSEMGFVAGGLSTFLVWAYMYVTGIFLMEVSISMKERGGFLEMAEKYLPFFGKALTGALFIFLYGILLVAYISAGSEIFCMNIIDSTFVRYLFPCTLFGILTLGSRRVITIISFLTIPMWIYFFLFYFNGASHIKVENLMEGNYSKAFLAVPILFGAFGYHNVIPSISKYLQYDKRNLRISIFWGSLLPCIIYLLWQGLILGIVDAETIRLAREKGVPIVTLLGTVTKSGFFLSAGSIFAFFAIITSALGVSVSMVDFIDKKSRNITNFLVILLPAIIAFLNPGIFLRALSFAGGFGESLLNGVIPVWMYAAYKSSTGKIGKKLVLSTFFLFLIALFVVIIEVYQIW